MTRSEIIELMARRMFDDEYRAMDELVSAMDRAAGKKCHVHSLGKWESVNKLYEERAKSALNWVQAAGLAIVPIEPSEKMVGASKNICIEEMARSGIKPERIKTVIWTGDKEYRATITAAIKEQEGRD